MGCISRGVKIVIEEIAIMLGIKINANNLLFEYFKLRMRLKIEIAKGIMMKTIVLNVFIMSNRSELINAGSDG